MTHVNRLSYIVFVVRKTHDYWSLGFAWSLLLFITLVRMGILNFAVEASTSISKHYGIWQGGIAVSIHALCFGSLKFKS